MQSAASAFSSTSRMQQQLAVSDQIESRPTTRAVTIDGTSLEDLGLVARNNRDVAVAAMIGPSPAALQVATDSLKSDRGPFSKLANRK